MKRGTPNHPKTHELARLLAVRRVTAIGHLELLFHFTAQYAPEGNIGKYSNKWIAAALDWPGNPDKFIDALVQSGWIDRDKAARLLVHDWSDHADRSTLQHLSRQGKKPIQRNQQDTENMCTQSETKNRTIPIPEPHPEPEIIHTRLEVQTTHSRPINPDFSDIVREIWNEHPRHRRSTIQSAENHFAIAIMGAVDEAHEATEIRRRHAGWIISSDWRRDGGRYCPHLNRWLQVNSTGANCMTEPPAAIEDSAEIWGPVSIDIKPGDRQWEEFCKLSGRDPSGS